MVLIARELSSLLLPELEAQSSISVVVKEIFLSERVMLDIPSFSEHDTKDDDTTDKDTNANNKLVLCLLMYIIA